MEKSEDRDTKLACEDCGDPVMWHVPKYGYFCKLCFNWMLRCGDPALQAAVKTTEEDEGELAKMMMRRGRR